MNAPWICLRMFVIALCLGTSPVVSVGTAVTVSAPLEEARAAVAAVKARGPLPAGGIVVEIPGGVYHISTTIALSAIDGGTAESPVVWRSSPGDSVVVSGGVVVSDWRHIEDPAVLSRLFPSVRGKVLVADMEAAGVSDFGQIEQRGSPGIELFHEGERMRLAQYPNEGWLRIADVPQSGGRRIHEGLEREQRVDGVPVGRHYGRIKYPGNRPSRWAPSSGIYAHGYWVWDWSDSFQLIESIDPTTHEITFAEPHHHYGYAHNQRFRFLNVLEELDQPGEWFLDREAKRIYFYPPSPIESDSVVISLLSDPLISLDGVSHFSLEGFTFAHGRSSGLVIADGESCQVAGSTFRELGGEALVIRGGRQHRAVSNDFHELATGAIRVTGGDRASLTPSHHEILNNHIYNFSQWLRTGQLGIYFDGVGQRIAHNLIHDAPFEAMRLKGNDHVIEFNEVYRVCTETGDAGALHTGRDFTWQGNIIRHNYWHDLKGPGLHGITAVYLDDFSSGFEIYGNVFYRAGRGVQIGGGRHNTVANNVFIECDPSVHLDARGLGWARYYFNGVYPWLFERFEEMHGNQPPYTDRYPELETILEDEPAVPKGNVVKCNVSWGSGRWSDVYDFWAFDFHNTVIMRDNLVGNAGFMRRRSVREPFDDPYYLNIDSEEGYSLLRTDDSQTREEFAGNEFVSEPPGEYDHAGRLFRFRDPSAMARIGFKKIPLERMGLQLDAWRTELPDTRE